MDPTLILSAAIFTLLALVVATSLLIGNTAKSRSGSGLDRSEPQQNGHVADKREEKAGDDWCESSGSSDDHRDAVKRVQSEEEHPCPRSEELAAPVERSSSSTSSSAETSSAGGRGSSIELSDQGLLKCAFSQPQTEGAAESPEIADKGESNETNSLKYVPGKARSHHLEMMMSEEELEQEQRVQREQLAAIFQLLQENKETFGEVTEGDMEEQLRLYSI